MKLKLRPVGPVPTPRPSYAKPGDAGLDLAAAIRPGIVCRDVDGERMEARSKAEIGGVFLHASALILPHGASAVIPTGWAFEIPRGYEGQVRPRSSASERRIHVATGTIDASYRGEVSFLVENRSGGLLAIHAGDRLAQIVIAPVATVDVIEVEALDETERGAAGWGSTGT